MGQLVVEHMGNRIDVDAARSDICRHEHPGVSVLEVLERPLTGVLRLVAVNGFGADARILQLTGYLVGTVFGACENDGS